jgi:LmbE family N-acetylglucosaminyl deacetylase
MTSTRASWLAAAVALLLVDLAAAQMRVRPVDLEEGSVALGLALRHLANTGVFMQATAHPDDENNALHVFLNRGQGIRTVLATATRGDGGQNEIGPEIFDALAVLRTGELGSMHRFDASEQYFTRAVDFGYSFSIEETLEKWGRDEIIGDYVRLIRMTRPDVIHGMNPTGTAGGLHHQTSGLLSREAFKAAADPSRYPEQIREGLRPWQAGKFYYPAGGPGAGGGRGQAAPSPGAPVPLGALRVAAVDISGFDSLLGRTFTEVGSEERSMHKSQAMAQLLSLPSAPAIQRFLLMEAVAPGAAAEESSLFEGIDTTIPGLARFANPAPPLLTDGLRVIADRVADAQKQFDANGPYAAAPALAAGLDAVRALRKQLSAMSLSDDARYNIDQRLKTKEDEFSEAAVLAHGLRLEVLADDGIVVPGEPLRVSVMIGDRARRSAANIRSVMLKGFDGGNACTPGTLQDGNVYRCELQVSIPAGAKPTKPYWKRLPDAARYEFEPDAPFGLPFRPTPFRAAVSLALSGAEVALDLPVEYRYEGKALEGEKRMELTVVPALALRVSPDIAIVPAGRGATAAVDRDIRVTVTNGRKGATTGQVKLEVPAGWRVTPATSAVSFTREDEAHTIRFTVRPDAKAATGQYPIRAVASAGTQTFDRGYQTVEYPHIQRRQLELPAVANLKVMDVRLAPSLNVGYVMGTGDDVPSALRGLGATVRVLDADDLAFGDLNRYDAIVVGIRAYDSRDDLRASNKRILEYAQSGGTVIVQYNRDADWAQYAPYAARGSSTRVTDENGEVQVLATDDPVFHYPNEIGSAAWRGWVQERGTYFIDAQSPEYTELIQVNEPFDNNKGWKKGALVEARVGKGRWIYVGLGLWRQLAAGTDGAYQLFANLISRGKLPGAPARDSR